MLTLTADVCFGIWLVMCNTTWNGFAGAFYMDFLSFIATSFFTLCVFVYVFFFAAFSLVLSCCCCCCCCCAMVIFLVLFTYFESVAWLSAFYITETVFLGACVHRTCQSLSFALPPDSSVHCTSFLLNCIICWKRKICVRIPHSMFTSSVFNLCLKT